MKKTRAKLLPCRIDGTGENGISGTIARQVRERRQNGKIKQKDFADKIGISRSRLQAIESGRLDSSMHVVTLMRLAAGFATTPDCMLGLRYDRPLTPGAAAYIELPKKKAAAPGRATPPKQTKQA